MVISYVPHFGIIQKYQNKISLLKMTSGFRNQEIITLYGSVLTLQKTNRKIHIIFEHPLMLSLLLLLLDCNLIAELSKPKPHDIKSVK